MTEILILDGWIPEAVVFDCDGLLVDTEPCWTIAETELFGRRGLRFGTDEKALVIGRSLQRAAETMAELFGEPGSGPAIENELLELVETAVSETAEAMPGAAALVDQLANSLPIAVASNSPRALLEAALDRGGLSGLFPHSIAADEVSAPKPDPEIYRSACDMLGVEPSSALAFEDSMTGVTSARAAGMRVIGVPTLQHSEFSADHVVESLTDHQLVAW
ncbi:MAG TPA: HAD family phosphatase, partial [Gemmatimonadaceae bacterium]|nr:HAD family phosphatase [Gemmatimonadaceae bacterium]